MIPKQFLSVSVVFPGVPGRGEGLGVKTGILCEVSGVGGAFLAPNSPITHGLDMNSKTTVRAELKVTHLR